MKEAWVEGIYNQQMVGEFAFRWVSYEWHGSKYAAVYIPKDRKTGKIANLPWPVKIVEDDIDFGYTCRIVRKDVGLHIWWFLVLMWYKMFRSRPYYKFKFRVIKTFEIWGMAYQPEGSVLSWKSIGKKLEKFNKGSN